MVSVLYLMMAVLQQLTEIPGRMQNGFINMDIYIPQLHSCMWYENGYIMRSIFDITSSLPYKFNCLSVFNANGVLISIN